MTPQGLVGVLTPFVRRRLIRVAGGVVGLLIFVLLQQWQSGGAFGIPSFGNGAVEPAPETDVFFTMSTTTPGVPARVLRAVDGDTIEVKLETMKEAQKVRLLGINTPESVDPRRSVQCFGKEASKRMKDLIEGKQVLLIEDPKADDRDKYGRLLRSVVRVEDSLDVNATLVNQGYANAYLSFPLDVKRKARLRLLEQQAKEAGRGLWSPTTCAGKK